MQDIPEPRTSIHCQRCLNRIKHYLCTCTLMEPDHVAKPIIPGVSKDLQCSFTAVTPVCFDHASLFLSLGFSRELLLHFAHDLLNFPLGTRRLLIRFLFEALLPSTVTRRVQVSQIRKPIRLPP